LTQSNGARAAAAGNDETARLYGKYARQLYRYCLARLRSPEEAEDAVQNTFVRVHGALAKGTTPRFEAAWLYKIAHNVCLTRVETRSRRAEHELACLDEIDVAAPETPREALLGLEAALASMPKNLRDAILLREWQGLTYAEIADSLDTSVPAVETLIFRARRHLASALQPAGAAVLDAGTVYGALRVLLARLRSVLGTLGPAKLAAGVAAATLGTAGVTVAVADLEAHPPGHDPAPTATVRGAVPAADTTAVTTVARVVAPRHVTRTPIAKPKTAAPSHVAAAAPVRAASLLAAPTTTAAAPVPAAVPATTPAAAPAPAPTTTAAASLPPLPTTTSQIGVPTLAVPTLQTPTVAVPTVPTLTTPELPVTVSVPTVTLPALP
jgi:RNA polymerase sigma factor (sigma-70 family)